MSRVTNYGLMILVVIMAVAALASERDDWLPTSHHSTGALGPPVTFSLPIGGRSAWGYPTKTQSHFYAAWINGAKARCGRPVNAEHWSRGAYRQRFRSCQMSEPPARIQQMKPTPITQPIIPGPVGPTVTPVPMATLDTSSPVQFLLSRINADRAVYGIPPLTLDTQQSAAAQKHSNAEAATGSIWHVNPSYPQQSFPQTIVVPFQTAGENTGDYGPSDVDTALIWIDQSMMNEVPPADGHRKNILSAQFQRVGIGVTTQNGITYQVTDFVG